MIKKLWMVASAIAVANLLALLAFTGWLAGSGRLSPARIEEVRRMLGETPEAQAAREAAAKQQAADATAAGELAAREGDVPRTAAEQIKGMDDLEAVRRQRVERLRREVEDLQRTLARGRAELESGWTKLEQDKKAFEDMRARIAALEGSEQFEKALRLYESLKPQQAQTMLQKLIDQGETDQAVAYLNAMQTRTASKIVAEFKDPAMAADLLERLRTRGLEARGKAQARGAPPAPESRTPDARRDGQPASAASVPGG